MKALSTKPFGWSGACLRFVLLWSGRIFKVSAFLWDGKAVSHPIWDSAFVFHFCWNLKIGLRYSTKTTVQVLCWPLCIWLCPWNGPGPACALYLDLIFFFFKLSNILRKWSVLLWICRGIYRKWWIRCQKTAEGFTGKWRGVDARKGVDEYY